MDKLKVVEFEGLAPTVFLGLYFADQGAQVIMVARKQSAPFSMDIFQNIMNRNKKCIALSLKEPTQFQTIKDLIADADVIIDPYRPGVLQKLKIGPQQISQINSRAILLRVSGYGQSGAMSLRPGHDLNYLAVSGLLPHLNGDIPSTQKYQFPTNYVADFVSASLGVTGVLLALEQRAKTGKGKIIDCSLADGCTYYSQFVINENLKKENEKNIRFVEIDGRRYCITGQGQQTLKNEEILKCVGPNSYFFDLQSSLKISQVKQIPKYDPQQLINPFSNRKLSNLIPKKGENNEQIVNDLNSQKSTRSKL